MATVYEYEIQIKVVSKLTGHIEEKTSIEYAYSVADAAMQAALNHSENGQCDVFLLRISPSRRAIEAAAADMAKSIETIMGRIKKASK